MPIPELDEAGFLPPGLHLCTLTEIGERFGAFAWSNPRHKLMSRLQKYVEEIEATKLVNWLGVDGSFATSKPEPGDIDLLVVLRADYLSQPLPPFKQNAISRRYIAKKYEFDTLPAPEGSPTFDEYLEYFQQVKGRPGIRKGLLQVML